MEINSILTLFLQMDDQLNDETTCGSVDSHSQGITITPRVRKHFIVLIVNGRDLRKFIFRSYQRHWPLNTWARFFCPRHYRKIHWTAVIDIHHPVQQIF